MNNLKKFVAELQNILQIPEEDTESRYWNGKISVIYEMITQIEDEDIKQELSFKLHNIVHIARKSFPEDSKISQNFRDIFIEIALEYPELSAKYREELGLPPSNFDYLTRQGLTDQETLKYNQEQNKKKDEFYKKTKKKPPKNAEEEQLELAEYKLKIQNGIKEKLLDKIKLIDNEAQKLKIDQEVIFAGNFDENYVDRISRVKSLRTVKNEGLEGKIILLRIDIEKYEHIWEDIYDEDGKFIKRHLKAIDFFQIKETILQSMNFMLDNRAKSIILIADFGPKAGLFNPEFSMRFFYEFLIKNNLMDNPLYFVNDLEEISDFDFKLENEVFKENSLIIVENLNFFQEEIGYENDKLIDLINLSQNSVPSNNNITTNLKYVTKMSFLEKFMKGSIFINDSTRSIGKNYPSIIDYKFLSDYTNNTYNKAIGLRLNNQISKITNFFSINTQNFILVLGDADIFIPFEANQGKANSNNLRHSISYEETQNFNKIGFTDDDIDVYKRLIMLNFMLLKFKTIFIFGKLALYFIQFVQKDYIFNKKFEIHHFLANLMKLILTKAQLNNIELILPEDGKYIVKSEYSKFFTTERKN
jgi:hypothetical protein